MSDTPIFDTPASETDLTRRSFLKTAGAGIAAAGLLAEAAPRVLAQAAVPPAPPIARPEAPATKPIPLPRLNAPTEQETGGPPLPLPPEKRLGIAVVGLGTLSLEQILPALGQTKYCKLTALVSGTPDKAAEVAAQYGIDPKSVYSYDTYDSIKDNPDVDIIYIVLPNSQHAEYTIRGAKAGKHILCEKPMAVSVKECQQMIDACRTAGKKLMIAYRIQYEPTNRMARQLVQNGQFGKVKLIECVNGQNQGDPNQWRQKKALAGGGALPDVGLYCLNTTRYLTGEEPNEVFARTYSTPGDPRFAEVEEMVTWQMRFPSGIQSNHATTYGTHQSRRYRVHAETGWFGLDPAFAYNSLRMEMDYAQGKIAHRDSPSLPPANQFALEMDHMALCVMQDKTPWTPGEEGLQDQRIMDAIYESARTGKAVALKTITTRDTFRGSVPLER